MNARLLAAVAAGGAVGAVLRWLVGDLAPHDDGFPWSTFGINVVGSFLLALLPVLPRVRDSRVWTVALGPGVLGGFTTLSACAEETRALAAGDHVALAGLYVAGTLVACVAAVHLARAVAGSVPGAAATDRTAS